MRWLNGCSEMFRAILDCLGIPRRRKKTYEAKPGAQLSPGLNVIDFTGTNDFNMSRVLNRVMATDKPVFARVRESRCECGEDFWFVEDAAFICARCARSVPKTGEA